MSSSSCCSTGKCGAFARYSMVDKNSGQEVGVLLIHEGQGVPDLGQVELKICKAMAGDDEQTLVPDLEDLRAAKPFDVNGNKEKSVNLNPQKVSSLTDPEKFKLPRLTEKSQNEESPVIENVPEDPISMYKKPVQFGWVRKVTLSSTVRSVTSVTYSKGGGVGKKRSIATTIDGIRRVLRKMENQVLSINHFCMEKRVLGLENLEVIKVDQKVDFSKPFKFGWLRKVTIRSRDMRVTCITHLTPPNLDGSRQNIKYKKDIDKYLKETGNKDLGVEDFVTVRKVLGLSSELEIISYSDQSSFTSVNDVDYTPGDTNDVFFNSKDKKKKETVSSSGEDCKSVNSQSVSEGSSIETIDDSFSSSEEGTNNDSNNSDTDDDSSDAMEPVIAPYSNIPYHPVSTDLSMDTTPSSDTDTNILPGETAASIAPSCTWDKDNDSNPPISGKDPTVSQSPSVDESFSQSLPFLAGAAAQSTLPAGNPPPSSTESSHQAAASPNMAMLLMVSTGTGGGRRQQKMMIKSGVKVSKGMKIFGSKFGLDFRKLRFFSDGNELSGEELAGKFDGAKIVVEELG